VPVPPGLKERFAAAHREMRAAESHFWTVQQELRRAIGDKESFGD
jgi:hypothetical protein